MNVKAKPIQPGETPSFLMGLLFFVIGYVVMLLVVAPMVGLIKGATRAVVLTRRAWKDL